MKRFGRKRAGNPLERVNKELKRRTRVAGLFPNEASLLRLVSALRAEISDVWETGKIYLNMENQTQPSVQMLNDFTEKNLRRRIRDEIFHFRVCKISHHIVGFLFIGDVHDLVRIAFFKFIEIIHVLKGIFALEFGNFLNTLSRPKSTPQPLL